MKLHQVLTVASFLVAVTACGLPSTEDKEELLPVDALEVVPFQSYSGAAGETVHYATSGTAVSFGQANGTICDSPEEIRKQARAWLRQGEHTAHTAWRGSGNSYSSSLAMTNMEAIPAHCLQAAYLAEIDD